MQLLVCMTLFSLDAAIPLNKQLYTLSYVCVTAGAAALVFSAFYVLVYILLSHVSRSKFWFCRQLFALNDLTR